MFETLAITYSVVLGAIAIFGTMFLIGVEEDFDFFKVVAGLVLWPLAIMVITGIGVYRFLPHRNSGLSRRQSRKIEYESKLLEIERRRNDELERSMKIITS